MGNTKDGSAFEQGMVAGARRAAGFNTLNSYMCVSRMVHQLNDIQPT
jgi:hypothetical protein